MKFSKKLAALVLVIPVFFLTFSMTACQKEGTAEKAGKKVDKAVEDTKEAVHEATK